MTDTPPRVKAVMAALNAAVDHPDLNVWRDPAGDIVGPPGVLAVVAVDALRTVRAAGPSVAEVVSATRVLLDALGYQPDQTPDVVEARTRAEDVIDRYDRAQPPVKDRP